MSDLKILRLLLQHTRLVLRTLNMRHEGVHVEVELAEDVEVRGDEGGAEDIAEMHDSDHETKSFQGNIPSDGANSVSNRTIGVVNQDMSRGGGNNSALHRPGAAIFDRCPEVRSRWEE